MSSFTGLYVQRLSTGAICDVQIIDAAGNENSLAPDVYLQRGIQPPIEQLPDLVEYNKINAIVDHKPKERTFKSIVGWVTLSAVIVAVIAAALSVQYDCYGVAYNSEQCLWSRSLFLLTLSIFFVIAWPVSFIVGLALWWWKDQNA